MCHPGSNSNRKPIHCEVPGVKNDLSETRDSVACCLAARDCAQEMPQNVNRSAAIVRLNDVEVLRFYANAQILAKFRASCRIPEAVSPALRFRKMKRLLALPAQAIRHPMQPRFAAAGPNGASEALESTLPAKALYRCMPDFAGHALAFAFPESWCSRRDSRG